MSNKFPIINGIPVKFVDPNDNSHDPDRDAPNQYWLMGVSARIEGGVAGDDHLGAVGGILALSTAAFSRPADTNAYAVKDAVANSTSAASLLTFSGVARKAGGQGYVSKARLMTTQSTNTARFRLHLFSSAPTPINDNAQLTLLWSDRTKRVGYFDFPAAFTEGTGSDAAGAELVNGVSELPLPFVCAAGAQALFGMLEALDAFTPASGQQFFIELTVEQY